MRAYTSAVFTSPSLQQRQSRRQFGHCLTPSKLDTCHQQKTIFSLAGRHISCQIDSKEDASGNVLNNVIMDMNADGMAINGDHQQQSLMRSHPSHVKVTLILSRNYRAWHSLHSFLFSVSSWTRRRIDIYVFTSIKSRHCSSEAIGFKGDA